MAPPRFENVDAYVRSLDVDKGRTIQAILGHVLATFPDLECKVAWNVPQIHVDGEYIMGLSSAKNHLSIAPWSPAVMADFQSRLEGNGLVVRKNLFQIPDDWELDIRLLDDLVRARRAEVSTSTSPTRACGPSQHTHT